MIPFSEVRVLDRNSEALGIPTSKLMENAGGAVARLVLERFSPSNVLVVCGPGNNGGDGFVTARYLAEKQIPVSVILVSEPIRTEISRENYNALPMDVRVADLDELEGSMDDAELIIDALLGSGLKGPLREPYNGIVEALNFCNKKVVSVDVPTGLGTDMVLEPDLTITFHDIKEGMQDCGPIEIVDIGIPPEASEVTGPGELTLIPTKSDDSHKGVGGRVLIIGGGPFTGAPALAGMGALRTGSDLVAIAAPESASSVIASFSPNLIVRPLKGERLSIDHVPYLSEMMAFWDSVLIGPGMGAHQDSIDASREIISSAVEQGIPIVVDADALRAFIDWRPDARGVVTPHGGEMRRLHQGDDPIAGAKQLSEDTGLAVLLKGMVDIIVQGGRMKSNRTGNSGMTVGGTGDVLSGITASLCAMGIEPFDSARCSAYISGSAGDLAFEEFGASLLATDIIERIPDVLRGGR